MDMKDLKEYVEAKEMQVNILLSFCLLLLTGYLLFFCIVGCNNAIKKGLFEEDNIKEYCDGNGTRKASKTSGGYSAEPCQKNKDTNG